MSKRFWFLALFATLVLSAPVYLSGAAQAGPVLCPNGAVDPGEDCDTNGESATCDDDCTNVDCGDNNVNEAAGETCDDGNTVDGDGCSAACVLTCGNGAVDAGEDCDTSGESATCDDDCTNPACGDDNVNETAGEVCDDGNTADGDTCSGDCLTETLAAQTKQQQACINAVNKNLAGVVKAQTGDNAACVKAAAGGDAFATCYGTDVKTKVSKAQAKTTKTTTGKKCIAPNTPTIAFTTDATVNDAGETQTLEGTTIVLGATPTIALKADKEASGCQAEAIKQYNAISNKWLQEANKAKKTALKGGKGGTPPAVQSGAELATAIDAALDDNEQVVKVTTKSGTALTKKCTDAIIDANFDCAGAATVEALRACIVIVAQQAACEAFEAADGLALACLGLP